MAVMRFSCQLNRKKNMHGHIKTKSIEYFFIIKKKSVTVGILRLLKQIRWANPMGERFDRFYQTLVK